MTDSTSTYIAFTQHPNLLWQAISAQAGTAEKAICELASNAFDADATAIEIRITSERFEVRDNGTGFGDEANIMAVFRTFGLPHDDNRSSSGRVKIGRFRAGRGQIMTLSACSWRSGPFEMHVDLKPDPDADRPTEKLGFHLTKNLEHHPGCLVQGTWYRPLSTAQVEVIRRELREQLTYLEVPLILNGIAVNLPPSEQTWTRETSEAYIDARQTENLTVYNRGVYVARFPATRLGFGGIIVTKTNLRLNIARNEISAGCPVWKNIVADVTDLRREQRQTSADRMTLSAIQAFVTDLLDGSETIEFDEAKKLSLFEDMTGRKYTIAKLAQLPSLLIDDHDYRSTLGDQNHLTYSAEQHKRTARMRRLTTAKTAIALDWRSHNLLSRDGATPALRLREGLDRLATTLERSGGGKHYSNPFRDMIAGLRAIRIVDIDEFFLREIEPIDDDALGAHPRAMLEGCRRASVTIAKSLGQPQRSINACDTGDLEWATPGHTSILVDKQLLVAVSTTTTRALSHIVYGLVCAYVSRQDCTSSSRDPDLLTAFHDIMANHKAFEFAMPSLLRGYLAGCAKYRVMPWKEALRAARRMGIDTDVPDVDERPTGT